MFRETPEEKEKRSGNTWLRSRGRESAKWFFLFFLKDARSPWSLPSAAPLLFSCTWWGHELGSFAVLLPWLSGLALFFVVENNG